MAKLLKKRTLPLCGIILICAGAFAQEPGALTAAQKQLALDTFQSVVIATSAADALDPEMTPGTPGTDPGSQKFVQMSNLLKGEAKSGACQVQHQRTSAPGPQEMDEDVFNVVGSSCLISYASDDRASPTSPATYTSKYQVNDSSYAALTDVDAYTLTGSMGSDASGNLLIQAKGTIHSRTLGELSYTVNGAQQGDQYVTTLEVQFPQFMAVVTETAEVQGNTTAILDALNGVQLTDQEVQTYLYPVFEPSDSGQGARLSLIVQ